MAVQYGNSYDRDLWERQSHPVVPFGSLPFDHFVAEKWIPTSPLRKDDQKEELVREYLKLGYYGRRSYVRQADNWHNSITFPPSVPQDLHTPIQRYFQSNDYNTYWIRTWYGNNQISEADANTQYTRLAEKIFHDDQLSEQMGQQVVFDDIAEFKADGDELQPFQVPGFIFKALVCYPDGVNRSGSYNYNDAGRRLYDNVNNREGEEVEDIPEVERDQVILVFVADQRACLEGKVLCIGLNQKGQMLPGRLRNAASEVAYMPGNWDDGQALAENFSDDLVDEEIDLRPDLDGWD